LCGGTRWRSWLRHCATSRKVASSIPDGVIGFFYWHNPSERTMALGSTQPLKEMSTRNVSWGWRRPVRRADNLTTFMCRLSWNLGASTSWNPQALSRPVMGLLYLYLYLICVFNLAAHLLGFSVYTISDGLFKSDFLNYIWTHTAKVEFRNHDGLSSVLTNHFSHATAGIMSVFDSYTKHTLVEFGTESPCYTASLVYPFGFSFLLYM